MKKKIIFLLYIFWIANGHAMNPDSNADEKSKISSPFKPKFNCFMSEEKQAPENTTNPTQYNISKQSSTKQNQNLELSQSSHYQTPEKKFLKNKAASAPDQWGLKNLSFVKWIIKAFTSPEKRDPEFSYSKQKNDNEDTGVAVIFDIDQEEIQSNSPNQKSISPNSPQELLFPLKKIKSQRSIQLQELQNSQNLNTEKDDKKRHIKQTQDDLPIRKYKDSTVHGPEIKNLYAEEPQKRMSISDIVKTVKSALGGDRPFQQWFQKDHSNASFPRRSSTRSSSYLQRAMSFTRRSTGSFVKKTCEIAKKCKGCLWQEERE